MTLAPMTLAPTTVAAVIAAAAATVAVMPEVTSAARGMLPHQMQLWVGNAVRRPVGSAGQRMRAVGVPGMREM